MTIKTGFVLPRIFPILFIFILTCFLVAGTVNYTYDEAGRLIKVEYGNGKTIDYVYDNAGNLLQRIVSGGAAFCAHVASDDFWMTLVSVINAGAADNPVVFEAFDAEGSSIETVTLPSLPPSASYEEEVGNIFSPATFNQDIWVKISSNSDIKGVMAFGTRDEQTLVTIPIFSTGATDLIFPYVVALHPWYTGITLINTGSQPTQVTLHAYSEAGVLLESFTPADPIPPLGKYVRLVEFIFPTADPAQIRSIHVESDNPLIGFELFGNWDWWGLAGLPAFSPTTQLFKYVRGKGKNGAYTIYYNEIPDSGFYYTGVTFSNLGSQATSVHVELYDEIGTKLEEADWPVGVKEQITREIWFLFQGQEVPGAAYLEAGSDEKLMGFELYLTRDPESSPFQFDGVIGMTGGAELLYFPMVKTGIEWATFIRLTNLMSGTNNFTVYAFAADGSAQGTFINSLPEKGKFGSSLTDMFPSTVDNIKWLYVQADGDIIGDAFYVSSDLSRMSSYMGLAGVAKKK